MIASGSATPTRGSASVSIMATRTDLTHASKACSPLSTLSADASIQSVTPHRDDG
jgi:hypothetical protein